MAKHMGKLFATLAETFWCSNTSVLSYRTDGWVF